MMEGEECLLDYCQSTGNSLKNEETIAIIPQLELKSIARKSWTSSCDGNIQQPSLSQTTVLRG